MFVGELLGRGEYNSTSPRRGTNRYAGSSVCRKFVGRRERDSLDFSSRSRLRVLSVVLEIQNRVDIVKLEHSN
jgi:hypothetical protein